MQERVCKETKLAQQFLHAWWEINAPAILKQKVLIHTSLCRFSSLILQIFIFLHLTAHSQLLWDGKDWEDLTGPIKSVLSRTILHKRSKKWPGFTLGRQVVSSYFGSQMDFSKFNFHPFKKHSRHSKVMKPLSASWEIFHRWSTIFILIFLGRRHRSQLLKFNRAFASTIAKLEWFLSMTASFRIYSDKPQDLKWSKVRLLEYI